MDYAMTQIRGKATAGPCLVVAVWWSILIKGSSVRRKDCVRRPLRLVKENVWDHAAVILNPITVNQRASVWITLRIVMMDVLMTNCTVRRQIVATHYPSLAMVSAGWDLRKLGRWYSMPTVRLPTPVLPTSLLAMVLAGHTLLQPKPKMAPLPKKRRRCHVQA